MNLKSIALTLITTSALSALTSCDGGGDGEDQLTLDERDSLTAESLTPIEVSSGDIITFTPGANYTATPNSITLGPAGSTTAGSTSYEYKKAGEFVFTLSESSTVAPEIALQISLVNTLTNQSGTGATLDSRLRTLLHREEANFTNAELVEIASILNPSGANLEIINDSQLIAIDTSIYYAEVTSSRGDQRRGTMGGLYYREASFYNIAFRAPTDVEKSLLRFVGDDDLIPYVTSIFTSSEQTEDGSWDLRLVNSVD